MGISEYPPPHSTLCNTTILSCPNLRHNNHPHTPRLRHHTLHQPLQPYPPQPRLPLLDLRDLIHMLQTHFPHHPCPSIPWYYPRVSRFAFPLHPDFRVWTGGVACAAETVFLGCHAGCGEEEGGGGGCAELEGEGAVGADGYAGGDGGARGVG